MIVKVCGITNQSDADAAVAAGANALGFNFYSRSPRYVTAAAASRIETPAHVLRVGVFVNEARGSLQATAAAARLHIAQLHGDETPADAPAGLVAWKAARVGAGFDFLGYDDPAWEALVLDGPAEELYGGAGKIFDWALAGSRAPLRHIILAGGLDASNVARAVAAARPWGVDACSRIESAPGIKDHRKMTEFIIAAKAALGV